MIAWVAPISTEVIRFALVGFVATTTYFVTFNAASYGVLASPAIANLVAFALSLAVSYLGHKHMTFKATGGHAAHLPKFLVITSLLVGATSALSVVGVSWLELPPFIAAGLVAVTYPTGSFFLNKYWVFRRSPND